MDWTFYRPRSEGDNVLGSVRPSVRQSVRLSVRPLTAEPTTLIFGMEVDLDLG